MGSHTETQRLKVEKFGGVPWGSLREMSGILQAGDKTHEPALHHPSAAVRGQDGPVKLFHCVLGVVVPAVLDVRVRRVRPRVRLQIDARRPQDLEFEV